MLIVILPSVFFLIKRSPQQMGLLPDGVQAISQNRPDRRNQTTIRIVDERWAGIDWTLQRALKTMRFWAMFITFVCSGVVLNLMLTHQSIYSLDIGSTPTLAANVLSVTGGMTIVGSIANCISDRIGRELTYTIGAIGSILALVIILSAANGQLWLLYMYAVMWGIFFGVIPAVILSGSADVFFGKHMGSINGFLIMAYGIGGSIGPWFGGYIYDIFGSYVPAFVTSMILLIIASIFFWFASPRKVRTRDSSDN
jgi:MFS family permease